MSRSVTHCVQQLNSWRRYASEVDVDFVRKSVKAIGQAAIKIEEGAERCVNVLLDLIATRVSYVVQEAVVVMKVSGDNHSADRRLPHHHFRISSGNTHHNMKASFQRYAPTSMNLMNQRPKPL